MFFAHHLKKDCYDLCLITQMLQEQDWMKWLLTSKGFFARGMGCFFDSAILFALFAEIVFFASLKVGGVGASILRFSFWHIFCIWFLIQRIDETIASEFRGAMWSYLFCVTANRHSPEEQVWNVNPEANTAFKTQIKYNTYFDYLPHASLLTHNF